MTDRTLTDLTLWSLMSGVPAELYLFLGDRKWGSKFNQHFMNKMHWKRLSVCGHAKMSTSQNKRITNRSMFRQFLQFNIESL